MVSSISDVDEGVEMEEETSDDGQEPAAQPPEQQEDESILEPCKDMVLFSEDAAAPEQQEDGSILEPCKSMEFDLEDAAPPEQQEEDESILEPCEGMEFDSEDAIKIFYDEYARKLGFVMRVMSCRRSEKDGRILARRFGCNKEGHCVSIRGKQGNVRKPRPSTREGCKAMIHVKFDKSGKWTITKFVKEHNHPLVVVAHREARQTLDEKDKRIQELSMELRNKKRLCAMYQEQLSAFMKIVEEHSDQISTKVQNVVRNIKELESIE